MATWKDGRLVVGKTDIERVAQQSFSTKAEAELWALLHMAEIISYYSASKPSSGSVSTPDGGGNASPPAPTPPPTTYPQGTVTSAETLKTFEDKVAPLEPTPETSQAVGSAFGPAFEQLADLKKRYVSTKMLKVTYTENGAEVTKRMTLAEYERWLNQEKTRTLASSTWRTLISDKVFSPSAAASTGKPTKTSFITAPKSEEQLMDEQAMRIE